ncbi:MAG: hypothetical protein COC24_010235 [Alphaproteobacteria bacterium]|nr:hypothetical protein [Alphaproteobacteria bacterium]
MRKVCLTLVILIVGCLPVYAYDNVSHDVDKCACDKACYTEEVTNLSCGDDVARFKSSGLPNQSHGGRL